MRYDFENSIGVLTAGVSSKIGTKLDIKFKNEGFDASPVEWTVISSLSNKKQCTQNDLANITGKNKVFIKRLIDELEEKDLVQRKIHNSDKRFNQITITEKGRKKYERLLPIVESTLDEVFKDFNEIEVNTLLRLLRNVAYNL